MSEHDAILRQIEATFGRLEAAFDRINAMLQELLDHLDRRQQDAPLHQRGFGVMDEEGA